MKVAETFAEIEELACQLARAEAAAKPDQVLTLTPTLTLPLPPTL